MIIFYVFEKYAKTKVCFEKKNYHNKKWTFQLRPGKEPDHSRPVSRDINQVTWYYLFIVLPNRSEGENEICEASLPRGHDLASQTYRTTVKPSKPTARSSR